MSRRNIDQRRKERILAEINQIYDEAYELGYQSGRRQNEHDIAYTGDIMAQALKTLKELTEESAKGEVLHCKECADCKQIEPNYLKALGENFIDKKKCDKFDIIVSDNDYCSFGKRKEDETR